jgi:hypothetical protein
MIRLALSCLVFGMLVALAGCGTTTERTTKVVEREDFVIDAVTVESPIGTFTVHPSRARRFRTEDTVENGKQTYDFPEGREIGGAILGGLTGPLAGGGLVGLVAAWFMRSQAQRSKREQDELTADAQQSRQALQQTVAGVEQAKQQMSPAEVDILHNSLSKTMDASAKARVRSAKAQV